MGTFNVRGFKSSEDILSYILPKIDLLCIQEHWLQDHNLDILQKASSEHHTVSKSSESLTNLNIISGGRGKGGVATYLRKKNIKEYTEVPCQSSRILATKIILSDNPRARLLLINCYLPCGTASSDQEEYQTCLAEITHLMDNHQENGLPIVIAGDFNVDLVHKNSKKTLEYMRSFMLSSHLSSMTEQHCTPGQFTFQTDDGKKRSSIDGFLVQSVDLSQYSDLSISEDIPLNTSDHYLVTMIWSPVMPLAHQVQVRSSLHTANKAKPTARIKIKWDEVSRSTIRECYTVPIELVAVDIFTKINVSELPPSEAEWALLLLSQKMLAQSKEFPYSKPNRKSRGKPEWNANVSSSYQEAKHVWMSWKKAGKPKGVRLHNGYLHHKKEFRRNLRQSRAQEHRKHLTNIEDASLSNSKLFHYLIKKQRSGNGSKPQTDTLEYKDRTYQGSLISDGWKQYFTDLAIPLAPSYDCEEPSKPSAELKTNTSSILETALITSKELDNAIFSLKRGKASGPDDISPEHLLYLGETARRLIVLIYNSFLAASYTPQSLKDGLVLPLHKGKGKNPRDPKNYRGITLTSTLCKLLELVLKPRIESSLLQCDIPDELQFGFQKGHSCLLTSCCLDLVLELNTLSRKPT
ncbi:uncharacterized protein LOC135154962 [Lytechinus pictus]|uniref:uncharacterized protein LOC135154962 n=1 Tax=Lytechinus pictus TaxID=7653 RepID=UPI0030B9EA20